MWWIWLVPSIVVAGAMLAAAAGVLEVVRGLRGVRRRLGALTEQAREVEAIVARTRREAELRPAGSAGDGRMRDRSWRP